MKSITGFFIGSISTVVVLICVFASMRSEESLWEEADVAFHQQSYAHAEQLYRKLVIESGKPQDPSPEFMRRKSLWLLRLARIYNFYLYRPVESLRYYEQLAHFAKKSPELEHLARVALLSSLELRLHRLADPNGAENIGEQMMEEYPTAKETRQAVTWLMGMHLYNQDFHNTRELARYIQNHWTNTEADFMAQLTFANTYLMEGKAKKAIDLYTDIAKHHSSPRHQALVAFELGQCYQAMGNSAKALEYFYSARPHHPNITTVENQIQHVRARIALSAPTNKIMNARLAPPPQKPKKNTR
jgi:tetratricopeptide (TPR) repeat protein